LDQDDALWNSSSLRFAAWSTVETIQNPAMASKGMEVSNIKRVGGGDHYSGYVEFNGIVTLRGITASDRCTAIKKAKPRTGSVRLTLFLPQLGQEVQALPRAGLKSLCFKDSGLPG